jgi:hypothetical protein
MGEEQFVRMNVMISSRLCTHSFVLRVVARRGLGGYRRASRENVPRHLSAHALRKRHTAVFLPSRQSTPLRTTFSLKWFSGA